MNTYDKYLWSGFLLVSIFVTGCNGLQVKEGAWPADQISLQKTQDTPSTVNIQGLAKEFPVILFAEGSTHLSMKARKQIREIARQLNHPDILNQNIVIEGHSDTSGDAHYNMILSRKRAESVSRELVINGIRDSRLIIHARGESQPMVSDLNDDGIVDPQASRLNRRVEIQLDKMDLAEGHL